MQALQPKHNKLNHEETEKLMNDLNISLAQLPKIRINDTALPENCKLGDIIKIERKDPTEKVFTYYRVVSV